MPNAGNLYIGSESLTVKLGEKSSGGVRGQAPNSGRILVKEGNGEMWGQTTRSPHF